MSETATPPAVPTRRRHDLDWVRVLAFALLVLYHVGMLYVSWGWHLKSPHAGPALEPWMLLTAPWRLSLLFLVSGVATACLLAKRQTPALGVDAAAGPAARSGFLRERSWRLLLPLAFGALVIVPPQAYLELLDSSYPGGWNQGYLAFWARYLAADRGFCDHEGCLVLPTWNHLWFLAYLWVYTVLLVLLARHAPGQLAAASRRVAGALATPWGLLLGPVALFAGARLLLLDRFGSTHALVDDVYNHVQYLGAFLIGFAVAHAGPVWAQVQRLRWPALGLWLASWSAIALYFAGTSETPPPLALRWTMRAVWGLNQWCAVVAVLGFARRCAPGDSPALRYLVQAVLPVYILHQTVLLMLAWQLRPAALPPLLEGPLLVLLTLALSFAGYEAVRRVPLLRPLFGLKRRS
jgi:hypothetical protein